MELTKKINKFAERMWLVIAILSTLAVFVFRFIDGEFNKVVIKGKKIFELISLKNETSSKRFSTKTKHKKTKKTINIFFKNK